MVKKRDWLLILGAVFIAWIIDAGTKQWALKTLSTIKFYGPLGLVFHRNPGAMRGMFSDLPAILRIVSLSTGGAFLIFAYASIQYLLPMRSMLLRMGLSLLLGGILGNVTDRIIWGSVIDFIVLKGFGTHTPAFNLADAIQWVGYFMVVWALIRDGSQLWPENNSRKRVWVNRRFQTKYIFILIGIGLGFSIISGVYSYTYLQVTIDELVPGNPMIFERRFLRPFLITFLIISAGFVLILFLIGRILSHRVAGPVYAFGKYAEELLEGNSRVFRVRKSDEFSELEKLAQKLRERLIEIREEEHIATLDGEPIPEDEDLDNSEAPTEPKMVSDSSN